MVAIWCIGADLGERNNARPNGQELSLHKHLVVDFVGDEE